MPIGSIGELLIEGPTAARGYLNDETKTAKAFIINPQWSSLLTPDTGVMNTVRMYKSGDLVRYNSDGSISYIGRKDTQIKLNGQRIELGEIEFHVSQSLPDGTQSAVELVTSSNRTSTKALAVFFSLVATSLEELTEEVQPASTEVAATETILLPMDSTRRDICKSAENSLVSALPPYMVPSVFIPVKKMPWTAAGKLDRNLLRNLVQNLSQETMAQYRLTSKMNKKQASTDIEKKILKIVCSVLKISESSVGVDDNFIRLGGDSISAMRLVASAQLERLEVSVADIFKNPKLSDIAKSSKVLVKPVGVERDLQPFELLQQSTPTPQVLDEVSRQCRVPKTQIQDVYPTSNLQEALFTLSLKQAGAYVAQHVLELTPSVSIVKLKSAWEAAVREIDTLRTRIIQLPSGDMLQAVLTDDAIHWHEAASLDEVEADTLRVSGQIGEQLTAYTLVHTNSGKTYFVWTIHHSLYDGWSIALMLQRVQQIYQDKRADLSQTSYTKFLKYVFASEVDTTREYWKAKLAGTSAFQFPQQTRIMIEDSPDSDTLTHSMELPSQRRIEHTQANIARAAWAMLLAAYTGSDDVVFGETLTGRDIPVAGIANVYGPTLTTVPTRVRINREENVSDLLNMVAAEAADRISHQHYGLSKIKRIDADSAAACDFQNLLVIQTTTEETPGSMWSVQDGGAQRNFFTYPLVIECTMGQNNIDILAHYHTDVISTFEIQRLVYAFESILKQLYSVPRVQDIKPFSVQDMSLLQQWNGVEPVIIDDTVPDLFFKMAKLQPNATAVSAWDGELTYASLLDLSCSFAERLVGMSVCPDDLVPACLDKSRWAIVAIMGILIAGAGYVPLSPTSPISRQQQILEECKPSVVVCSPKYKDSFTKLVSKVVCTDDISIPPTLTHKGQWPLRVKSDSVCYVIFTSGSTGKPKGVMIEHRAVVSSSAAICKGLHISPQSRVFQFCSFVFDVSIGETLAVLTRGATICMPSDEQRTTDVASAISSLKADWAFLTPTVANLIEGAHQVPTLKTLVTGGEAMTPEVVNKFASSLQLCNGYGPTEGTVFAVTNDQVSTQRDPSIIGRATESGRAWLTVPSNPQQLSPLGAIAELCIEGPFLARCYLNNPEKTAASFLENPSFLRNDFTAKVPRIYRTGDLVKYLADGSIRYVGRRDNQVKIAGQRIELGDIEHHLQRHEAVQSTVVQVPNNGPGKDRLIAIVSLTRMSTSLTAAGRNWNDPLVGSDVTSQIDSIKEWLSDQLPSYMVPSAWIAVQSIPLLTSDKVDRKKVGAWLEQMEKPNYQNMAVVESSGGALTPATRTAQTLQRIWAKVLGLTVGDVKTDRSWLCKFPHNHISRYCLMLIVSSARWGFHHCHATTRKM
jgi:amino acid adenylation domain-containing protein